MLALTLSNPLRLTVEEYMASNLPGRTELIDGAIYEVSPQNPAHANAIDVLNKERCELRRLNGGRLGNAVKPALRAPLHGSGLDGDASAAGRR